MSAESGGPVPTAIAIECVCHVCGVLSVQEAPGFLTVQFRYVMGEYSVRTGPLQVSVINHV